MYIHLINYHFYVDCVTSRLKDKIHIQLIKDNKRNGPKFAQYRSDGIENQQGCPAGC